MANLEHLDILSKGTGVWNTWRQQSSIHRPDLTGASLSHLDLSEANLAGVYLNNADLSNTILINTRLPGADLNGTNLMRASIKYAFLNKADLRDAFLDESDLTYADLRSANLNGAHLRKALLLHANLTESHLNYADLKQTDLTRANLTKAAMKQAILDNAVLRDAILDEADLSGASLNDASCFRASLVGTNLRLSSLINADFRNSDLEDADFTKAIIGGTVFGNNDLSVVRGLDLVRHSGPSIIGVETINRSQGVIPEVFLRGAGVPEEWITYIPALSGKAIQFYSCFISYSHADRTFARRLHDALQGRGIRCWLDEHQLLPGDDIYSEVDRAIRLWDKILLCCSQNSLTSWWVDNEITTAFAKEQILWKEKNKEIRTLIPLDLDRYLFNEECTSGKAEQIRSRLAADFTGWEHDNDKFDEQFERIVRALRSDGGGHEIPPRPRL